MEETDIREAWRYPSPRLSIPPIPAPIIPGKNDSSPGITIRDRLRVLYPNDSDNYYRQRDIVPMEKMPRLGQAKIHITNFHSFQLREKISASKLTKSILSNGKDGAFTETPDQMVRRVCRSFGNKKNIIVINDEPHH